MKVEKMFNKGGVSLDHSEAKRLPIRYRPVGHVFELYGAETKANILEEMEIDFEREDNIFIFDINGSKYKVYSNNLDYWFFSGTRPAMASKVE